MLVYAPEVSCINFDRYIICGKLRFDVSVYTGIIIIITCDLLLLYTDIYIGQLSRIKVSAVSDKVESSLGREQRTRSLSNYGN